MKKGFTLIELAVVLVVIGLLVAGVTAGSSIRDQAALRSVVADMKKYQTAYATFVDLYKMPPGDFNEAHAIWGADCADVVSCNGDGDNIIDAPATSASETHRAWKQLQLSELIDLDIPIVPSTWSGNLALTDAPASQINAAGFFMAGNSFNGDSGAITSPFASIAPTINAVFLGKVSSTASFSTGAVTGLRAYNLDQKFDDGKIIGGNPTGNDSGILRTVSGQSSGTNCITGGNYNIISTLESCVMGYQLNRDSNG